MLFYTISYISLFISIILASISLFIDSTGLVEVCSWFAVGSIYFIGGSATTAFHALVNRVPETSVWRVFSLGQFWIFAHIPLFLGCAVFWVIGFEPFFAKYMALGVALLYVAAMLKVEMTGVAQIYRNAHEMAEGVVDDMGKLSQDEFNEKYNVDEDK